MQQQERQKLSKYFLQKVQRFCLFTPVISAFSWRIIRYLYRKRPFLTTLFRTLHIEGDVIECGVFWGRSIIPIAFELKKTNKTVFALDSFAGFRDDDIGVCDVGKNRSKEMIKRRFKQKSSIVFSLRKFAHNNSLNLEVVPGFFEETLPKVVANRKFSYVHLDCDLYSSYHTCLPLLYPALVPGGIMLFDEYKSPVWPGATKAIDEFLADKPENCECIPDAHRPNNPKYVIVKQ
jgi:O-methyltransferase